MYEIENNIKPKERLSAKIRAMEVDQSMKVEIEKTKQLHQRFADAGYKCRTEKIDRDWVRVWRTQ